MARNALWKDARTAIASPLTGRRARAAIASLRRRCSPRPPRRRCACATARCRARTAPTPRPRSSSPGSTWWRLGTWTRRSRSPRRFPRLAWARSKCGRSGRSASIRGTESLRLELRLADHLRPLGALGAEVGGELIGLHGVGFQPLALELLLHVRRFDDGRDLAVEALDHGARRARRRDERIP